MIKKEDGKISFPKDAPGWLVVGISENLKKMFFKENPPGFAYSWQIGTTDHDAAIKYVEDLIKESGYELAQK